MNILALDIATQTGWTVLQRGGRITGGSESFAPKRGEAYAQRWLKFRQFLSDTREQHGGIHVVYYEHATQGPGQHQAALVFGGFLAMLQVWCEVNRVRMVGIQPATIKKHWTGKGNAKKADMIEVAKAKGFHPIDDNHADALALLSYAREQEQPLEECAF